MITVSEAETIKKELRAIAQHAPQGALQSMLGAIQGGEVRGDTYDFCLLAHATGSSVAAGNLSNTLLDELGEDRIILHVEHLVLQVEKGHTPENTQVLRDLEHILVEVISE